MEECYFEFADHRGIDPGDQILKILVNALKNQLVESRESRACQRRVTSAFAVGGLRGVEFKAKIFEPGNGGEASGHCLGVKRIQIEEYPKVEYRPGFLRKKGESAMLEME